MASDEADPIETTSHILRSPNAMVSQACREYKIPIRDKHDGYTKNEWSKILNFVAWNVADGLEKDVLILFRHLFESCGQRITEDEVKLIADYQANMKKGAIDLRDKQS